MLSDLDREVGVIFFANTSLSEKDGRYYSEIFDGLWKHAVALKDGEQHATAE